MLNYVAPQWMIPPGLRFGALLLARPRHWPWLIAGEWAAHLMFRIGSVDETAWLHHFITNDAAAVLVVGGCIAALRRFGLKATLRMPEDVARLLAAALLTAFVNTLFCCALSNLIHPQMALQSLGSVIGSELLREYLGSLLIVPIMIMAVREPPERQEITRTLLEALFVLLPILALLLVMLKSSPPLPGFARILALVPVLLFAFRNGWRGAVFAMVLINGGMMAFTRADMHQFPATESLLFLAVAGTGALVLGAASDALRRSSRRLSVQNARLEGANRRLDQLARQLSEVARRNLRTEEQQRRYVAAELHDELGQNLTAIQTRVKLAQTRLREAGLSDVSTSINDILAHMRAAVRRLLNSLRPTVLDEFGLARALEDGPIRDLLKTAGVAYHLDLRGNLQDLDEDTRITVYRVVQEAATNTVRHAMASHFMLRVLSGKRNGRRMVALDMRDDGVGLGSGTPGTGGGRRGGHGLQSMRDRVTALGGTLRIHISENGTRLRILLPASGREA
ncbi:two-component system sensor histidine kinase UhpB [Oleiagrimonas soli]|uniref:Two-component system sensor histidine kinase UhpB n=1 Tax=Oleiagrimonas soli TaxID=1543381 RepID=A0A841KCL0_9GAMM|nr:two-component system sensor histidine kinase UhpB [Oleiagrimonas soli]